MQYSPRVDIDTFTQQLEAMYDRLGHLYTQVDGDRSLQVDIFPAMLKELGIAAEELQVAKEELSKQNELLSNGLETAATNVQHHQALFDLAPQAQLITTLDGKIQAANHAVAQLLRTTQRSLIGRHLIHFIAASVRDHYRSQFNKLKQSNLPLVWMSHLKSDDGELLELTLSVSVVYGRDTPPCIHWLLQKTPQLQAALTKSLQNGHVNHNGNGQSADLLTSFKQRTNHCYDRGDVISFQPQTVWYVIDGLVKLTTLSENNEEILLGLVSPGMPFAIGSASLFTYQATALTEVRLAALTIEEIESHPELAKKLFVRSQHRLQQTEALLNVIGQRRAKDRLVQFLQLLKREIGQSGEDGSIRLAVRLTHEDLANACGTTRVTVTRLLGKLQNESKVAFDSKSHIILNPHF